MSLDSNLCVGPGRAAMREALARSTSARSGKSSVGSKAPSAWDKGRERALRVFVAVCEICPLRMSLRSAMNSANIALALAFICDIICIKKKREAFCLAITYYHLFDGIPA